MLLLPVLNLLPATLNTAAAAPSMAVNVALPSEVFPIVKVTLPATAALPLAAFTIAVNWVVALNAMLAGLAATTVVVATGDAVTSTIAEPADTAKLGLAA
jgi:hypothetical protein